MLKITISFHPWRLGNSLKASVSSFYGRRPSDGGTGAATVRLVIDKLNRNDRGVPALRQTILIPGHWHEAGRWRP